MWTIVCIWSHPLLGVFSAVFMTPLEETMEAGAWISWTVLPCVPSPLADFTLYQDFLEVTAGVTGRACATLPKFFKPHLPAFPTQGSQRKSHLGFRPTYTTCPRLRTRVLCCHLQPRPSPLTFSLSSSIATSNP